MRRPCADREEKRVTRGKGMRGEKQLDPDNPNQRGLLAIRCVVWVAGNRSHHDLRPIEELVAQVKVVAGGRNHHDLLFRAAA